MLGNNLPKGVTVIHLRRVRKFVNQYVVNELEWQFHEGDIKADGTIAATTSPPPTSM